MDLAAILKSYLLIYLLIYIKFLGISNAIKDFYISNLVDLEPRISHLIDLAAILDAILNSWLRVAISALKQQFQDSAWSNCPTIICFQLFHDFPQHQFLLGPFLEIAVRSIFRLVFFIAVCSTHM